MGHVSERLIELGEQMMGYIKTKKDTDELWDEVQEWLMEHGDDLRDSASSYAKRFVKDNRKYKLASFKIIASEILTKKAQQQEIFSYGAFSSDGDMRYFDRMTAYLENNQIKVYHTGGGAAGGMDSFGGGTSDTRAVETFSQPIQAPDIINWIKRTMNRNSGYPFLSNVKLKNIKWTKADGSKVLGLSNSIVDDVLQSYNLEIKRVKVLPFPKWMEVNKEKLKESYETYLKNMKGLHIKGLPFKPFCERVYINTKRGTQFK